MKCPLCPKKIDPQDLTVETRRGTAHATCVWKPGKVVQRIGRSLTDQYAGTGIELTEDCPDCPDFLCALVVSCPDCRTTFCRTGFFEHQCSFLLDTAA